MNPDEAIKNLKIMIAQLKVEQSFADTELEITRATFEYYADKLESNLMVLEAAIIELKNKAEYWDRVGVRKDRELTISEARKIALDSLAKFESEKESYVDALGREEKSDLAGLAEWLNNG